jgi:hemolysin activation/secretion protein
VSQGGYRPGLDSDYTKLSVDLTRDQPLTDELLLSIGVSGQYGLTKIPGAEMSAFGGADYGRGYLGSVIYGDSGLMARAELSYSFDVPNTYLNAIQPFGYFDIGRTWLHDFPNGTMDAASTGFGARFTVFERVSTEFSFNKALTAAYTTNAGRRSKDPLYLFNVKASF